MFQVLSNVSSVYRNVSGILNCREKVSSKATRLRIKSDDLQIVSEA